MTNTTTTIPETATLTTAQLQQLVAGIKQSLTEDGQQQKAGGVVTPAETLSQSELFQRYLDAPVRVDATNSTLVADQGKMAETTARNWFLYEGFGESLPTDYAEELLAQVEGDECPLFELQRITGDLSDLLAALNALKQDFCRLTYATRTEQPHDDEPDEVYRDWEENPRYVLPVIERKEVA